MKMRREFENMVQEKDEQLKRLQAKLNEELTKEALKTAAEMAQAENLDAVIDIETGRVLYASQNVDYTAKFTERMNKHYDAEKAKTPAKQKHKSVIIQLFEIPVFLGRYFMKEYYE
jgi:hypothetical protein